jgi:putative hydrolase of the HAD superfamily
LSFVARGLVLDFGHVVLRTPFELHRQVEQRYGLPRGTLTWMGPYDPSTDALWRDMQAGRIGERDYWRTRATETERLAGRDGGLASYMQLCFSGPEDEIIRPELVDLLVDGRAAGLATAILSNELELFQGREWMDRISFLKDVDAVVDGSVTGVLKPDRQAYVLALSALELTDAAGVVFVDDQPVNVSGAAAAGMMAVHFDVTDVDGSVAAIRAASGLPGGRPTMSPTGPATA